MEYSPVLNFFVGLISSIGYYRLFFSINRPAVRWRFIVMLILVILSRPICVMWQLQYIGNAQGINLLASLVSFLIDFVSLLALALLGPNRKRALVASAFILFVIYSAVEVFVNFFMAGLSHPFFNSSNAIEMAFEMPQFYYTGIILFNIIVMCHCFFTAHRLRKVTEKTPVKLCVLFCLFLFSYSLIIIFWGYFAFTQLPPLSFFPSALLGALLMSVPLLSLYLFTQLAANTKQIHASQKESDNTAYSPNAKYAQFIGQLSKRELEVISALLAGSLRYKTLASSLHISINTVKTHLKHIYQITGVNNIEDLSALFSGYSPPYSEITPKSP